MAKQIQLRIPKVAITISVPNSTTHQDIVDAFTDDGYLPWLKQRIRDKLPAGWVIDSWKLSLKTSLGKTTRTDVEP